MVHLEQGYHGCKRSIKLIALCWERKLFVWTDVRQMMIFPFIGQITKSKATFYSEAGFRISLNGVLMEVPYLGEQYCLWLLSLN
jgi:hypothetical protein